MIAIDLLTVGAALRVAAPGGKEDDDRNRNQDTQQVTIIQRKISSEGRFDQTPPSSDRARRCGHRIRWSARLETGGLPSEKAAERMIRRKAEFRPAALCVWLRHANLD